jgi:hypothetical protein
MSITIQCSSCYRQLRIPEHLLGKRVKCPGCGNAFVVEPPAAEPVVEIDEDEEEAPASGRARPPAADKSQEDEEDEADEEIARPSRGQRRAREAVMGPAMALMIVGCLGIVLTIANFAVSMATNPILTNAGQQAPPQPKFPGAVPPKQDPAVQQGARTFFMLVFTIAIVVTGIWGVVVALGGYMMYNLKHRTSVMVALIFAMLPAIWAAFWDYRSPSGRSPS